MLLLTTACTIPQSPSDQANLCANKLWSHYRGGPWQEGELDAFILIAANSFGDTSDGGL